MTVATLTAPPDWTAEIIQREHGFQVWSDGHLITTTDDLDDAILNARAFIEGRRDDQKATVVFHAVPGTV